MDRRAQWVVIAALAAIAVPALVACGSPGSAGDSSEATLPGGGGDRTLAALTIEPPHAQLEILNGSVVTQKLIVMARYSDGSTEPVTNEIAWSVDAPVVGAVDPAGLFAPTGQQGGLVTVTARHAGQEATGSIGVKLHDVRVVGSVDPGIQGLLGAAVTADPNVVWTYPYDGTVFPRGLRSVPMMWRGAGAGDLYYAHVTSPYFELELVTPAAQTSLLGDADWTRFTESTSGGAELVVNRWDGRSATRVVHQAWSIAPAPLPGAVYYWAKDPGRLMRLEPGAAAPEDFTKDVLPASATAKCTTKCHAVSADGSTLVGAGLTFGGSYDLRSNKPRFTLGTEQAPAKIGMWGLPALSPDGRYVVTSAAGMLGLGDVSGMYRTADGSAVGSSGLPNELLYMPTFAPTGSALVYVSGGGGNATGAISPGALRIVDYDPSKSPMIANPRDIVRPGADRARSIIAHPTVAPDGRWVAYGRLPARDPKNQQNLSSLPFEGAPATGDLYLADVASGSEVRLAKLAGDDYPFAAGDRDRHTSFEPSFSPVPAGGYFWVVFQSRRTYGTMLTGPPGDVKQLWIAAIDADPKPGQDPSHPAFRLAGQSAETLNQRGIFARKP